MIDGELLGGLYDPAEGPINIKLRTSSRFITFFYSTTIASLDYLYLKSVTDRISVKLSRAVVMYLHHFIQETVKLPKKCHNYFTVQRQKNLLKN